MIIVVRQNCAMGRDGKVCRMLSVCRRRGTAHHFIPVPGVLVVSDSKVHWCMSRERDEGNSCDRLLYTSLPHASTALTH